MIEEISGGSYLAHPETYGSGTVGSCGLYNGTYAVVKLISGGYFQGSSVAFRNYNKNGIESVTGGFFDCPYMDENGKTFCDNTTIGNVFYNNAPLSVTGGTWYNVGTKINSKLGEGYTLVQGDVCEMTSYKTYTSDRLWEDSESGNVYYYYTVTEVVEVNSAEELTTTLEKGGVQAIKLGADITVDKTLVVSANDSFDIDLGGHMLKLVETDRMNMLLKVYGKLTVKNGSVYGNGSCGVIYSAGSSILNIDADIESVQSSDNYATLITVADNSVVNILGGSYQNTVTEDDGSGHYDLIYATHNGCVNIYGGTFKNYTPKWTLNCRDADDNSSVNVFGGKYYNFDPSKAGIKGEDTFVGENEVCVAEGYTVMQDGEWYAVVKA